MACPGEIYDNIKTTIRGNKLMKQRIKQKWKRISSILLAVCLVVTMVPGMAFADGSPTYDLHMGENVAVDDLAKDGNGTGWNWNAATATLTLGTDYIMGHIWINCAPTDIVNLAYTGDLSINGSGGAAAVSCGGNLNISGSGTLSLTSDASALSVAGDLQITAGTVIAETAGDHSSGILSQGGGIIISGDANVTASGTGADGSRGIRAQMGDLTISTTGRVTATGQQYAISANTTTINDGTVGLNGSDSKPNASNNTIINGGTVIYNGGMPPQITAIDPNSGVQAGGTSLTITGSGFVAGTIVKIDGTAATGVAVNSTTGITCTVPPGSVGAANVLVETSEGVTALTGGFTYTPGGPILFDPATATFNLANLPSSGDAKGGSGDTAWTWNNTDKKLTLTGAGPYTLAGQASGNMRIGADNTVNLILDGARFTSPSNNTALYLSRGGTLRVIADSEIIGDISGGISALGIVLSNATLRAAVSDSLGWPAINAWGLTLSGSGTVAAVSSSGGAVVCAGDLTVGTGCTLSASGTYGIIFQGARTISGGGNIAAVGSTAYGIGENGAEKSLTFDFAGNLEITGANYGINMFVNDPADTAKVAFTRKPASLTIRSGSGIIGSSIIGSSDRGTVMLQNTSNIPGLTAAFNAGEKEFTATGGGTTGPGPGSSGSGGATTTPTSPTVPDTKAGEVVTAVVPVGATGGANGTAIASIPNKAIADAIAAAEKAAKDRQETEKGIAVALEITMPKNATALTVTLTQESLSGLVSAGVSRLEINGGPVSLGLDMKALQEIQKQIGGNVNISIAPAAGLSSEAQTLIGNRPVFNITISGTKSGQGLGLSSLGSGTATISIPYTPASNEVTAYLFGVYVDEDGKVQQIPNSFYDSNSKSMVIPTDHFSVYGVGYGVPLQFTDISKHWAKASIEYVAAKGLVSGTAENTFSPNAAMTRGMLVAVLARLTEVDVKEYKDSSFTDVPGSKYYAPYIQWAYERGIIQGMGDGTFAPDKAITREQIAVIFTNYAKVAGHTLPAGKEAKGYADGGRIGSSYKAAVTAMQQAGIMTGDTANQFNPKSGTTRAEVSSMLHRYIEMSR